jgi:signal transduction histidine kinase
MLENYDQNWRTAGSERTAYYYNIPPGKYRFRIKAASSNGVWAEKSIDIIITPPWWRSWWAYTLYGLLLAGIAISIHRTLKQRVIVAERERTRVRELAQAKEIEKAYLELKTTQAQLIQSEKMASLGELTAGIAHEIQNPLNFINNFSEVNKELLAEMNDEIDKQHYDEVKNIAKDVIDNQEKINHHGKRADAIVKGMLQHSQSSIGAKEPTDINALADEYMRLAYHGLRAKDKSFNATLKTDFDKSIGKINIIPQDIGRVMLNLINNAFYAVDDKNKQHPKGYEPTVIVHTKNMHDKVSISVKDNGNGIPQKVLDKIFQPFFTTKPTGQGTGLGLSLSYDIVKAHGGEIKVDTKEGEFTEFVIHLPIPV